MVSPAVVFEARDVDVAYFVSVKFHCLCGYHHIASSTQLFSVGTQSSVQQPVGLIVGELVVCLRGQNLRTAQSGVQQPVGLIVGESWSSVCAAETYVRRKKFEILVLLEHIGSMTSLSASTFVT